MLQTWTLLAKLCFYSSNYVFSWKKRQILFFHCINVFSEEYFLVFVIFFRKQKAMEKVEVIEISSQLGAVQEICEFVERVHNIWKCTTPHCSIKLLNSKLCKAVFDETLDYDTCRNICVENATAFWCLFQLQKKVNENIERIVYLLEATNKT